MQQEQKIFLNLVLAGPETTIFEMAKDFSGLKSNAEFVRHLVMSYYKDNVK